MDTKIMWKGQVNKAFFFAGQEEIVGLSWWCACGKVLHAQGHGEGDSTSCHHLLSECVCEQEILRLEETSQRKWSATLETWNPRFQPRLNGMIMMNKRLAQQQRTNFLQILLLKWSCNARVWRWLHSHHWMARRRNFVAPERMTEKVDLQKHYK